MIFNRLNQPRLLICAALFLGTASAGLAETVQLNAIQDNTLFEEGDLSNGKGEDLFAGKRGVNDPVPNFSERRALLRFDLSGIPPGSRIETVDLLLSVNKSVIVNSHVFTVHRMTRSWGEGASNATGEATGTGAPAATGDATWNHAFFNTDSWTQAGGDFVTAPSASQSIGNVGDYSWSGAGLVADVQQWVNSPESNYGWTIIGPQDPFLKSVRRFSSREADFNPPLLVVTYAEGYGLWAGYFKESDGRSVFTDDFLGWIDVGDPPWVYVYSLSKYIYAPESNMTASGGWVWIGQ